MTTDTTTPTNDQAILCGTDRPFRPARDSAKIAVLAFFACTAGFMQLLVLPFLNDFPRLLDTSATAAAWIVSANLLTSAVAMPITGKLADLYGRKRVLVGCAALLLIGSVISAFATSIVPMVIGRGLQGAATSVIPLSAVALRDQLPARIAPVAIGIVTACIGIGDVIGMPAAALLSSLPNWRIGFWVAVVMGAVCLVGTLLTLDGDNRRAHQRFRALPGMLLLASTSLLMGALLQVESWGAADIRTIGLILGGLAILALFLRTQLRSESPLFDLRVFARREIVMLSAVTLLSAMPMYIYYLTVARSLQAPVSTGYGLGLAATPAALALIPCSIALMLACAVAPFLARRLGFAATLTIGVALMGAGYLVMALSPVEYALTMFVMIAVGFGSGTVYTAVPLAVVAISPAERLGENNGVNAFIRNFGFSLCSALTGLVLASQMVGGYPTHGAFVTVYIVLGALCAAAAVPFAILMAARMRQKGRA